MNWFGDGLAIIELGEYIQKIDWKDSLWLSKATFRVMELLCKSMNSLSPAVHKKTNGKDLSAFLKKVWEDGLQGKYPNRLPNFIAVDFVSYGDPLAEVKRINQEPKQSFYAMLKTKSVDDKRWIHLPGSQGRDIGCGPRFGPDKKQNYWLVQKKNVQSGGGNIYKYYTQDQKSYIKPVFKELDPRCWQLMPGACVRIDADPHGNAWCCFAL